MEHTKFNKEYNNSNNLRKKKEPSILYVSPLGDLRNSCITHVRKGPGPGIFKYKCFH